jgi:hypothetical protein
MTDDQVELLEQLQDLERNYPGRVEEFHGVLLGYSVGTYRAAHDKGVGIELVEVLGTVSDMWERAPALLGLPAES